MFFNILVLFSTGGHLDKAFSFFVFFSFWCQLTTEVTERL